MGPSAQGRGVGGKVNLPQLPITNYHYPETPLLPTRGGEVQQESAVISNEQKSTITRAATYLGLIKRRGGGLAVGLVCVCVGV